MTSTPTASTLAPTAPCPCGSGGNFGACCAPIIAGTTPAPDAEALMRSRYSAHVVNDSRYLDRTYLPTAHLPPVEEGTPRAITWDKLVIHRHDPQVRPGVSHVDFSAHFTENGTAGVLHEKSEFELIKGAWFFTRTLRQGPAPIVSAAKVGRNDPCPCGSGKKYKKCCG